MNKVFTFIAALLLVSTGWAGDAITDKPSMSTTQTAIVTATVEAIDYATREVTLRGPEGREVTFTASDEAKNLKQVKVGDSVVVEYMQKLSIKVFAGDGSEPGAGEMTITSRAAEGEDPALTAIDALVVTATVEEINIEANTFKLRGPEGAVKEYVARDPENLKKAEVGDLVVITYTQGIALSLAKTTTE